MSRRGAEALWGRETMAGLAHGGVADRTRLDAELGYGLPVGSRFVGTPRIGVGTSEMGRDYRLGYGLTLFKRACNVVTLRGGVVPCTVFAWLISSWTAGWHTVQHAVYTKDVW